MGLKRKLLPAGGAILLAMVFAASSAVAQEPLEVVNEATGEHCPPVEISGNDVTGGCFGHVQSIGDVTLLTHIPSIGEIVISSCQVELEGRADENGEGYAVNQVFGPPSGPGSCTRAPCDDASGNVLPWPANAEEVAGLVEGEIVFCVRSVASGPGGAGFTCHLIGTGENTPSHDYVGDNETHPCQNAPAIEVSGAFESERDENHDNVEAIH